MAIKYISDLHLDGRGPFLEEHPEYATLETWHADVISAWNQNVCDDDIVWVLGDVCLTLNDSVREVLSQLKGHLNLVRGNHDRVDKYPYYLERFEQILDIADVIDGGHHVVICHYPLESWNRKIWGALHIHGHVHGNMWDYSTITNRYNAWSTALKGIPRTLDWFIETAGYNPDYYRTLAEMIDGA